LAEEKKKSFIEALVGAPPPKSKKTLETEAKENNPLIKGETIDPKNGDERMTIVIESMQSGVERYYYWFLRTMQATNFFGMNMDVEKIRDVFGGGEASSMWGNIEQRKTLQQDKASQFLGTIGNMLKSTFQILRELRILDERKEYYDKSEKGDKSAEVALKSIWVDMVEGGGQNPTSVTGLSQKVGFVTLPDLFYSVSAKNADAVDGVVEKLKEGGVNKTIRTVLARKLKQFYIWKDKTGKEVRTRKKFVLKYLRQHFNVIKMYISWVRPYLQNVQRLQMQENRSDVDVASAFETAKVELELMGIGKAYEVSDPVTSESRTMKFKKVFPITLVKLKHVTLPQMQFQSEYQRGPIHTGRTDIVIEAYTATKEEIEQYKKEKDKEDIELLASVNSAMESLKEELDKYLEEAGEQSVIEAKEEAEYAKMKASEGILTPFTSIFKGFGDMFGALVPKPAKKKIGEETITSQEAASEAGAAKGAAAANAWQMYNTFKKVHGMYTL